MSERFLMNAWYVAGWAHELDSGMVARRIADVPIVIARDETGKTFALHDRCPHRFAPLSKGEITAQGIQCGYHGLTFDATGKLVANPLGGPLPAACRVRPYPIVVQDHAIWIWMGDPQQADAAAIPRFPCFDDPQYRFVYGTIEANAHYELLTDNLLDLTHAAFLHPSFGGPLYNPKVSMRREGDTVYSHYIVTDIPNPEFPECFWSSHGKNVDLWDDIRWNAPATMYLESGVVLTGRPRADGFIFPAVHVLTPASTGKTTYFWASTLPVDSPMDDGEYAAILGKVFASEDLPMIEAAWDRMDGQELWSLNPVMLHNDSSAVIARRVLAGKIKNDGEPAKGAA